MKSASLRAKSKCYDISPLPPSVRDLLYLRTVTNTQRCDHWDPSTRRFGWRYCAVAPRPSSARSDSWRYKWSRGHSYSLLGYKTSRRFSRIPPECTRDSPNTVAPSCHALEMLVRKRRPVDKENHFVLTCRDCSGSTLRNTFHHSCLAAYIKEQCALYVTREYEKDRRQRIAEADGAPAFETADQRLDRS